MKNIFTLSLMLFFALGLCAQEEEMMDKESMEEEMTAPVLSFSGSVDAYWRSTAEAPATSFANLNGFSLGMFNLVSSYEGKKAGIVADMVFGPRGEDATFLSPELRPGGSSNIVNQLYAYLNVSDNVTLTMGNFNTFLGYEVISPTANFNYSTSYMFSYGPFSHTGLKLDASFDGGFSVMVGILNPTDATEFLPLNADGDSDYFLGGQLGYDFGAGSVYLNTLLGPDYTQFDITGGVDLTDALYLGINATTTDDLFSGFAGYLQYGFSDAFALGVRAESFTDQGVGAFLPDELEDESVFAITLSANISVDNLTIIPEFRIDSSDSDIFESGAESSLSSLVLAVAYGF